MSEELSLSEIERGLGAALLEFVGVRVDFDASHRSQPEPGALLWQWGEAGPGARLWKTLAYHDLDGVTVIASILRRKGVLREVELLRGDNSSVLSVSRVDEIQEVTRPGIVELW